MAELVDAIDSKSIDGNIMRVRFSLWAQKLNVWDTFNFCDVSLTFARTYFETNES